jgi:hypothetical protein
MDINNYKYIKYKNKYLKYKSRSTNIDYNIKFIIHALLDEEASPKIGNTIQDVINDYKKVLERTPYISFTDIIITIDDKDVSQYDFKNIRLKLGKHHIMVKQPIYIFPFSVEHHAITLIINNLEQYIILVNTGLKTDMYHSNLFCFKKYSSKCYDNFMTLIDYSNIKINYRYEDQKTDTNIFNIYLYNLDEIYYFFYLLDESYLFDDFDVSGEIKYLIEKIDEINEKLKLFKNDKDKIIPLIKNKNNPEEEFLIHNKIQESGSCTYYSLLMSLYYYIYIIEIINGGGDYNDIFLELEFNIKNKLLLYLETKDYNFYSIKYLKIINRKYNNRYIDIIKEFYEKDKKEKYKIIKEMYLDYYRYLPQNIYKIRTDVLNFNFNVIMIVPGFINFIKYNKFNDKKIFILNHLEYYDNIYKKKDEDNNILMFLILFLSYPEADFDHYRIKYINKDTKYIITDEYISLSIFIIYNIINITFNLESPKYNIYMINTYLVIIFLNILRYNNMINIKIMNDYKIENICVCKNVIYRNSIFNLTL